MTRPRPIIMKDGRARRGSQWLRIGEHMPCVICGETAKLRAERKSDGIKFWGDTCSKDDCISKYRTQIVSKLRKEGRIKHFNQRDGI